MFYSRNVLSWYATIPAAIFSGEDYIKSLEATTAWQQIFASLGESVEAFKDKLKDRCDQELQNGQPLCFDTLVVRAMK